MKTPLKVLFLNQPNFSGHEKDQEKDGWRRILVPQIEAYISTHELFQGRQVSIQFIHAGASGLVSIVDTVDKKYVLKVVLRPGLSKGEAVFLKKWESVGVPVPHVYESGMIGDRAYVLMQYVDAQSLENFSEEELIDMEAFRQLGKILQNIHTTIAQGYGLMKQEGVGEYESFRSWLLEYPHTINQLAYVQEHTVLPVEICGSVDRAKDILMEYIEINPQSTYCHWDLTPGNVLHTNPLTVIDPVPTFNHPYMDVARSIVQTIGSSFISPEAISQLLAGYFSESETLNAKVLHAAVLFICHTKAKHWHEKGKIHKIKNLQSYLFANKYLLENKNTHNF